MGKLLTIGIIVLIIGVAAAIFAFKILPTGPKDLTTGAVAGTEKTGTTETDAEENAGLAGIEEGMTESKVKELAGEPLEKQTTKTAKGNTIEYWYYQSGDTVYQIGFSEGEVSVVRKY